MVWDSERGQFGSFELESPAESSPSTAATGEEQIEASLVGLGWMGCHVPLDIGPTGSAGGFTPEFSSVVEEEAETATDFGGELQAASHAIIEFLKAREHGPDSGAAQTLINRPLQIFIILGMNDDHLL